MKEETIYKSPDGRYFGDLDIWEQFESGAWTPVCWDEETGEEWVRTDHGEVLVLRPVSRDAVPDWAHVEHEGNGIRLTCR